MVHEADYLREQAELCRKQAASASDPATRADLLENAEIYEEVALYVDRLRASG